MFSKIVGLPGSVKRVLCEKIKQIKRGKIDYAVRLFQELLSNAVSQECFSDTRLAVEEEISKEEPNWEMNSLAFSPRPLQSPVRSSP